MRVTQLVEVRVGVPPRPFVMAAKRKRIYATKAFIYRKDGKRRVRLFDLRGKNAEARVLAECLAAKEISRMTREDNCEFLVTVYRDPLN